MTNSFDMISLPDPALPAFDLLPHILLDSFYITVVTYSVSLSMALVLAKKDHYEVNANQELLAQVTCRI